MGTLKGVNVAFCDMKHLKVMKKTVKVLGVHFSLNERLEHEFSKPYH